MRARRNVIIGIVLIAIGVGIYYYRTKANTTGTKLTTHTVSRTKIVKTLNLSGKIDAREKVSVGFQTGGKLTQLTIKEGDFVKKGQLIAQLDSRELQKQLQRQLNNYMITRWDFDQTKSDNADAPYKDGLVGERLKRIIDKSQFSLDNSVINVELQSIAKEQALLFAPLDGLVTKVAQMYPSMNVSPNQTIEIINPQTLYFSVNADQTESPLLHTGMIATITLDAYTSKSQKGIIQSIAFTPRAGENGTVYEVILSLNDIAQPLPYRIGMTGDAQFILQEVTSAIAVPPAYVTVENGNKTVTVFKNGITRPQIVQTGLEGDENIEILSGLSVGDVVVEAK
jgi:RND family efflux transporter MFP subunit